MFLFRHKSDSALIVALFVMVAVLAISQLWDHKTVTVSPDEKIAAGVYAPDAIAFATAELERIVNDNRNFPEREIPLEETLTYLVYLAEGSEQGKVDFCWRVLPYIKETHRFGDAFIDQKITESQQELYQRLNKVVTAQSERKACPSSDSKLKVST